MKNANTLSWILLFTLALLWGSSYILIKTALKAFPPDQIGTARMVLACILFIIPAFIFIRKISFFQAKYLFIVALIGNLIPAFLYPIAQTKITSSLTGILNAITPMFTLILGAILFRYQVTFWKVVGLLLGLAGAVLLVVVQSNGSWGHINGYAFFVVLATIFNALSINIIKAYLQDVNPTALTSITLLMIGPLSAVYLFTTGFATRITLPVSIPYPLLALLFLGLVNSGITLLLYYKLLQISSPIFASSVTYLMPVVAILWGILDGEKLYPIHYLGIVFILIGLFVVNRSSTK